MANELTFSMAMTFYKSSIMTAAVGRSKEGQRVTVSGSAYVESTLSVATSATLVPIGNVSSLGYGFFWNADGTNFLKLRNGLTGADLAKLRPQGLPAFIPLLDTATLYAIADTAACVMEYLIVSA